MERDAEFSAQLSLNLVHGVLCERVSGTAQPTQDIFEKFSEIQPMHSTCSGYFRKVFSEMQPLHSTCSGYFRKVFPKCNRCTQPTQDIIEKFSEIQPSTQPTQDIHEKFSEMQTVHSTYSGYYRKVFGMQTVHSTYSGYFRKVFRNTTVHSTYSGYSRKVFGMQTVHSTYSGYFRKVFRNATDALNLLRIFSKSFSEIQPCTQPTQRKFHVIFHPGLIPFFSAKEEIENTLSKAGKRKSLPGAGKRTESWRKKRLQNYFLILARTKAAPSPAMMPANGAGDLLVAGLVVGFSVELPTGWMVATGVDDSRVSGYGRSGRRDSVL